jgi:hypothetical protein
MAARPHPEAFGLIEGHGRRKLVARDFGDERVKKAYL